MTDGPKKPPPRLRLPLRDDEVVEIPPGPVLPREPFRHLATTNTDVFNKLEEAIAGQRILVNTQRKMALQLDGFQHAVNGRFDVLHEELALLRATVIVDHAPRLGKVEQSLGQKAAKGGGIAAIILLAGPMLAEALPKYRTLIESVTGWFQ